MRRYLMARKPRIQLCNLAEHDHCTAARNYAHVFHYRNVICVTPEFTDLPQTFQAGILLHELGHLQYREDESHTERDADIIGGNLAGVTIERRNRRTNVPQDNLEYVPRNQLARALAYIRAHTV